jgi:pilus assembly protein CpaB
MNPRQRRGILFMLLAAVIGVGVFLSVTTYVARVESQVGSLTTVFRASGAIDPYTPLSAQNLEPVEVPARWTSPTARLELRQLEGRRIGFRVEPGTMITSDMLLAPSSLRPNEREIAINVNAVTGIAGRIRPGDSVDIYAVFSDVPGVPKQVRVLVRNVRVVSIGGKQTVQQSGDTGIREASVVPVTLALQQPEALAVTYANSFAAEVRLVGLPTDVGTNRAGENDNYSAAALGEVAPTEPAPKTVAKGRRR